MLSPRRHHQKKKKNQDGIKFGPLHGAIHLEDLRDVDYVESVESVESVVIVGNAVSVENEVTEEPRANLSMDHLPRVRVFAITAKESLRIGGAREQSFQRRNMQGMDDLSNPTF
jgi:hypothetical protein